MTDTTCGYPGDRDDALVSHLYGELDGSARVAFDRHLVECALCRQDLGALTGVRVQLARWAPPEPARALVREPPASVASRWWQQVPVWAQVAAAMLVLGASASVANLNVHYGRDGLTVRTGWMKPAAERASAAAPKSAAAAPAAPTAAPAPWRADLTALEQQLRSEFRDQTARASRTTLASTAAATPAIGDAEVLRRVRALVEQSEKNQQRELALRVAEVARDVESQRRADLVKIDHSLGLIQNNTGIEVMKQRELLNYLVRVSQKQ